MTTLSTNTLRMWRWIFIIVQSGVFMTFSLVVVLDYGFGISLQPGPSETVLAVSYLAGLLFLLIASPYFFKSLGKLAVIGWIVTLGIMVITSYFEVKSALL